MAKKGSKTKVGSDKDDVIAAIPLACSDETAAVEFIEKQRWGDAPMCPRCACERVYKMVDAESGERNKRFLWRCHECKRQFTVRIGTVFEESRIPLRHWCYAIWRACTSKKGAAALEIKRHTGLTYKSSLFMMHRIRHGMNEAGAPKLVGDIESDEVWVGGKTHSGRSRVTNKVPVLVLVQRGGQARIRPLLRVTSKNLSEHLRREVDPTKSTLYTDEHKSYRPIGSQFAGGHLRVRHSVKEYSRKSDGAGVNRCESLNAIIKRSLIGIYHSVSVRHLHRYLAERQFVFNRREDSDGDRVTAAIQGAVGKRLMYRSPVAKVNAPFDADKHVW